MKSLQICCIPRAAALANERTAFGTAFTVVRLARSPRSCVLPIAVNVQPSIRTVRRGSSSSSSQRSRRICRRITLVRVRACLYLCVCVCACASACACECPLPRSTVALIIVLITRASQEEATQTQTNKNQTRTSRKEFTARFRVANINNSLQFTVAHSQLQIDNYCNCSRAWQTIILCSK